MAFALTKRSKVRLLSLKKWMLESLVCQALVVHQLQILSFRFFWFPIHVGEVLGCTGLSCHDEANTIKHHRVQKCVRIYGAPARHKHLHDVQDEDQTKTWRAGRFGHSAVLHSTVFLFVNINMFWFNSDKCLLPVWLGRHPSRARQWILRLFRAQFFWKIRLTPSTCKRFLSTPPIRWSE